MKCIGLEIIEIQAIAEHIHLQEHTLSHPLLEQFGVTMNVLCMLLDGGWKPVHLQETHSNTRRGAEPGTFLCEATAIPHSEYKWNAAYSNSQQSALLMPTGS